MLINIEVKPENIEYIEVLRDKGLSMNILFNEAVVNKYFSVSAGIDEEAIISTVCSIYDIPKDEVFSRRKERKLHRKQLKVQARHLMRYLIYKRGNNTLSLHQVGEITGNAHHTTVLHSIKVIEDLLEAKDILLMKYLKNEEFEIVGGEIRMKQWEVMEYQI